MLLHKFRHVQPDQRLHIVKKLLGEHLHQLGLAHAGRPHKDEGRRALLGGKPNAAAAHSGRHGAHRLILPNDPPFQASFQVGHLLQLAFLYLAGRDPAPQLNDLGQVVLRHRGIKGRVVQGVHPLLQPGDLAFQLRHALVVYLRPLLGVDDITEGPLLFLSLSGQLIVLGLRRAFQGGCRAGLIQQVYRLIGQEAIQDVPLGEHHSPLHHKVAHLYTVVVLVVFLNAPQHLDGVLNGRLSHLHGLEAPLQRSILFNVLAVLVKGRSTNDLNFSAGKRRL